VKSIEWKGKIPTPEDVKNGVRFHITGTLVIELNDILGCDKDSYCVPLRAAMTVFLKATVIL